jgi:CHASE3 domain sensor protein
LALDQRLEMSSPVISDEEKAQTPTNYGAIIPNSATSIQSHIKLISPTPEKSISTLLNTTFIEEASTSVQQGSENNNGNVNVSKKLEKSLANYKRIIFIQGLIILILFICLLFVLSNSK